VVPIFVRRALSGEPLTIEGDGEQKRMRSGGGVPRGARLDLEPIEERSERVGGSVGAN